MKEKIEQLIIEEYLEGNINNKEKKIALLDLDILSDDQNSLDLLYYIAQKYKWMLKRSIFEKDLDSMLAAMRKLYKNLQKGKLKAIKWKENKIKESEKLALAIKLLK